MPIATKYPTQRELKELDRIQGCRWISGRNPSQGPQNGVSAKTLIFDGALSNTDLDVASFATVSFADFKKYIAKELNVPLPWEQEDL